MDGRGDMETMGGSPSGLVGDMFVFLLRHAVPAGADPGVLRYAGRGYGSGAARDR